MKKEVAIAIVIGLILGLVVTFGIYTARRSSSSVQQSAEMLASANPDGPDASPTQNSLAISSPEDGLITSDKELQVSGTTDPNSFIFILFGTDYRIEKADGTGNFSTKIPTNPGPMLVIVRTLDDAGNSAEDDRSIYIGDPTNLSASIASSAATVKPSPSPKVTPKVTATPKPTVTPKVTASPIASPSSQAATESLKDRIDRILETRQEKLKDLEQAGQRRRIFIGEVLRITEKTVTLHNRRGNQSFTVGPEVVLSKAGKAATIDDIAIGDWISVIGFSDKETIQPQLVIISTTSLDPSEVDTAIGTIKSISKTQVVVTKPTNGDDTFVTTKTTQYVNAAGDTIKRENLQTETQAIVVSKSGDTQNTALTIKSLAGQR